jgi:hypothetical protein
MVSTATLDLGDKMQEAQNNYGQTEVSPGMESADDVANKLLIEDGEKKTELMLKMRAAFTGTPKEIGDRLDEMREGTRQRELEGHLNDFNHLPLILEMSRHRFIMKRSELREAIAQGKMPFIVARLKNRQVPIYYKNRGWTFDLKEAIRFNTVEQTEYWCQKLAKKHSKRDLIEFILPAIEGEVQ